MSREDNVGNILKMLNESKVNEYPDSRHISFDDYDAWDEYNDGDDFEEEIFIEAYKTPKSREEKKYVSSINAARQLAKKFIKKGYYQVYICKTTVNGPSVIELIGQDGK